MRYSSPIPPRLCDIVPLAPENSSQKMLSVANHHHKSRAALGQTPGRFFFSALRRRLLSVGLGDLADELGPGHVHCPIDLAGLRSRIVLEDFHHQSCVVRENDAGLQHAQETDLAFGLAEGSR